MSYFQDQDISGETFEHFMLPSQATKIVNANSTVDFEAVQSLLAMSQWSPPTPENRSRTVDYTSDGEVSVDSNMNDDWSGTEDNKPNIPIQETELPKRAKVRT